MKEELIKIIKNSGYSEITLYNFDFSLIDNINIEENIKHKLLRTLYPIYDKIIYLSYYKNKIKFGGWDHDNHLTKVRNNYYSDNPGRNNTYDYQVIKRKLKLKKLNERRIN